MESGKISPSAGARAMPGPASSWSLMVRGVSRAPDLRLGAGVHRAPNGAALALIIANVRLSVCVYCIHYDSIVRAVHMPKLENIEIALTSAKKISRVESRYARFDPRNRSGSRSRYF